MRKSVTLSLFLFTLRKLRIKHIQILAEAICRNYVAYMEKLVVIVEMGHKPLQCKGLRIFWFVEIMS